jgi:flagellar biosynthetic protein FliR
MWETIFDKYYLFLLVFARMFGMILFHPFLSRRSIPAAVRMGLAFVIALMVADFLDDDVTATAGHILLFMAVCAKELLIGFFAGFILELFLSGVLIAGGITDHQMELSMAQIYDPQTSASMPVTGTFYNLLYTASFFACNGHLTFIRLIVYSYEILPPGAELVGTAGWEYVTMLFGQSWSNCRSTSRKNSGCFNSVLPASTNCTGVPFLTRR